MGADNTEPQEDDLERTDRLPVLNLSPGLVDDDVADDAVRLDMASVVPRIKAQYHRPAGVDRPALAESLRAVEARLDRQKADFDALSRAHEKVRAGEQAALTQANVLAAQIAEKTATADNLRSRLEDALGEVERHQGEARTLKDTLVARDATIVQVLHSLEERDAQLNALQREHARLVPALEERSRAGTSLETDLRSAVSRADGMAAELRTAQGAVSTLTERIKTNELELAALRRELANAKLLAVTHQERLRTRQWREGFDQNVVSDLDSKLNAMQADRGVLKAACDQLRQRVGELESKLALREETIAKLSPMETIRNDLAQRVAALESEHSRLTGELAAKDQALADLRARPPESAEEARRLTQELAAKATVLDQVKEENRNLSAALERARSALEEREFQIRRLQHSESKNAAAAGRVQATSEAAGNAPQLSATASAPADCIAELVRIDGGHQDTHVLGRRSRVGRAPGCEVRIDSSSVSRHHALILVGVREVIVEDLNSTNGVLVNGRKVSRQLLTDGDQLTIGEAQFKLYLKVVQWPPDSPAGGA